MGETVCGWQVVEVPNVSWDDIGGLDNVKRELQEVHLSLPFLFFLEVIRSKIVSPFIWLVVSVALIH